MYSTALWCLFVVLLFFFWLYCVTTVTVACVQTSPLPQKKSGEETLREGGRLYTGYCYSFHRTK